MPPKPLGRCGTCGARSNGRCPSCATAAETRRGSATERGYTGRGHRSFRSRVLDRDPVCVLCRLALATVADHWPTSRRDLLATGQDPNDPRHGRGLCAPCHSSETTRNQPGGWNAR